MRNILWTVLALAAAALAPSVASADFVYTLDTGNVAFGPSPFGTVNVHLVNSTNATITFTAADPVGWTYAFGDGGVVAVNTNGAVTVGPISSTKLFGGGPAGPFSTGTGNQDGFGSFNLKITNFDGWTNSVTSASFTITKSSGSWADAASVLVANSMGYSVGVHLFAADSDVGPGGPPSDALVTGFAVNGDDGGDQPNGTPEPASIVLALTAIGGLGLTKLRRRKAIVA